MFAFLRIPFKKSEWQRICFDKSGQVTGQVATRSFSGSSSAVQHWRNPTNCSFTKRIQRIQLQSDLQALVYMVNGELQRGRVKDSIPDLRALFRPNGRREQHGHLLDLARRAVKPRQMSLLVFAL
jgi:hypothetical protein